MQQAPATTALMVLCCVACATVEQPSMDLQLAEAQKAFVQGQALWAASKYAEAVPLVERALVLRETVLTRTHPKVADCLQLLGDLHLQLADYAQAEPLLERALKIREAALGENHPDLASSLNSLALLYRAQGLSARAEPLYQRALEILEAALGDNHPDLATPLNGLAGIYQAQGLYARAEPLCQRALTIQEATLGENHPDLASSLNNLAVLYKAQGLYARAEPLYQRALQIQEAILGKNHPDLAASLNNLAVLYKAQGLYARAEPLYQRALQIREATLGENHPDLANSLNNLAGLYDAEGLYARAEPLYQRALQIREATLGENHPDLAASLNNLAGLYEAQGLYARAEPLYQRALRIQGATLGENHPDLATSLSNLAELYRAQGLYARAEPLYQRALQIQRATLGENHPDLANTLNSLAVLYKAQGLYERAELLYQRALQIREATLGEKHPDLATSLNNLAELYRVQAFYARAEPLYQRALQIWEATLGENHPNLATPLNNLAELYRVQGLYARAEPLYQRALQIREATLGKNHPNLATPLNNLAALYQAQGLYTRAEPLYQRALGILEATLDENHPNLAAALNNLAVLYQAQGLYARAEPLVQRALQIREATLGKNHPNVATSLNNLAILYKAQGLYARAEPLYQRALRIQEATLGENHPNLATSLNNLALLLLAQQRIDAALPLFQRAFFNSEKHLRQEVFGFSEERLASFLRLQRSQEQLLYALVRDHPQDPRVRHLALTTSLLRKSRSLKEVANTSLIIFSSLDHADRQLFERLRALHMQLATLTLAGPGSLSPTDYQQRLKNLADQGDALEADLARRSEPLRRLHELPPADQLVSQVSTALPRDSVLIEFVAATDKPLVSKPGLNSSQADSHPRYLAFLLFPSGSTHVVDLGPAEVIDRAALRLHEALAEQSVSYLSASQELYTLVFRPLRPHLGKAHRLFLTLDEQLHVVPFAALHDGTRFLVDTFHITYLTSGKDLLPRTKSVPPANSVVVLADPKFGNSPPAASLPDEAPALATRSAPSSLRHFVPPDTSWPPLPGTRREAEVIKRLFPHARLLLGEAATKQALLTLSRPGILHIATHGTFANEGVTPAGEDVDPLLRSALVLAGPQASSDQHDISTREDSLVTALELAGLNLWGTQLVVLSACDTGRGDIKTGQGVYGLTRAFMVAGAESLVTSLWKVNDETTQQFMEAYYRNLRAGRGRSISLRHAMQELRQKLPHPHFWAPFTAIGVDAPLQGMDIPLSTQPAVPKPGS